MAELSRTNNIFCGFFFKLKLFLRFIESYKNPKLCETVNFGLADTLSIKFTCTHLYTWVERDTVRVKYLVQEHNTMSPAKA